MHIEGLLPGSLCLFTLSSSEHYSQSERFRMQHVQMVKQNTQFQNKIVEGQYPLMFKFPTF